MGITVSDIIKLTTYDVRIEKRNEKGQLVEFDVNNYRSEVVKRIRPSSDGGQYLITIEI